ncbi:MAG TPA: hypothetical protein VHQ41_01360 [Patescibacteria group bacterium]|jgi:hypothetical protein|nr:hypothetical protein [Patescibacteria group bacterium]
MFTYNEVEEQLKKSHWPEQSVQDLLPVLPQLGKWSLSYVWQMLNNGDGDVAAPQISRIISQQPQWYQSLKNNNPDGIISTINSAMSKDEEFSQRALLANILDIRSNKTLAELVSKDLSNTFDQVEIKYLINVPPIEIVSLLTSRISNLINIADLAMEIKRYCYYRDSLDNTDPEVLRFKEALQNNKQLIGSDPKSVKDWIQDFLQSASTSQDRSTYNVAHYTSTSPLAQKLSSRELIALSEILQLYNWLLQPYVTESEVINYEQQRLGAASADEVEQPQPRPLSRPTPSASLTRPAARPQPEPSNAQDDAKSLTHQKGKYGYKEPGNEISLTDAAKIHDLISGKSKNLSVRGVTMDPTNVRVEEERERINSERAKAAASIQSKLAELRKRNQKTQ